MRGGASMFQKLNITSFKVPYLQEILTLQKRKLKFRETNYILPTRYLHFLNEEAPNKEKINWEKIIITDEYKEFGRK